ncbi:hypothetical protein AYX15_06050 [Cryptococcus neoformans]|nr:hypothetical protein AYX15_06050 [Cryptococcus neoformans var. grubii]
MPSRKKGRGRVIIASDCILKATGFLEKKDDEGNVIERARRIICPGLQEDNWWTAQDVVKQGGRMPWSFHRYLLEDGQPKGLESVLQVRGYPTNGIRTKCSPVCRADSLQNCCLARMSSRLSKRP